MASESQAKPDAILEAAAAIVATGGADALTTRRLAEAVGTSTMAVYTWYGSKANLLRAIYREAFGRFDSALRAVPSDGDPLESIEAMGWAYHRFARDNPHLYEIMFHRSRTLFDPQPADAALALGTFELLVDAVRRCVDAGLMGGEPRTGALLVWAAVHGFVSLQLAGDADIVPDGAYGLMMRTVFAGLGPSTAGLQPPAG